MKAGCGCEKSLKCEKQRFPWQHTCVKRTDTLESFNRELEEILRRERDAINNKREDKNKEHEEAKKTTTEEKKTDDETVTKVTNENEEQTKDERE